MINPPSTNFAEQWIKQYTQLNKAINYKAFDFNGIKLSLVSYLRTYHPEYFNNLTESDELLALIELFAYVGELYAYRTDVNTQEQILASATQKSSAVQIANMLGYTPSRRNAAIGLVKVVSASTTETIIDSDGSNLSKRVIKWSDPTNSRWKSQFNLVMQRVLNTVNGVFSDSDKTQVENITFERYVMNTKPLTGGVFKYSAAVSGTSAPMELVGTQLRQNAITELAPTGDRPLDILYANDGYGDASPTSGYMFLTKQGTLGSSALSFDGSVVNLVQQVNAQGINNTDIWLNAVDSTGKFISNWSQVDNIAYNQSAVSSVFQVVSGDGDSVQLVFGDGNYATIPNGTFQVWYRTSLELSSSIPTSAINGVPFSIGYTDVYGNNQTLTLTFSLQSQIVTSSPSETLSQLQQAVPGVFYTQDRMVNAQDHQNFLLQDPSIVKIKAVNRTFAGHSKYSSWYDGSESYENIKIFSNDGVLYLDESTQTTEVLNSNNTVTYSHFIQQYLTPLLRRPELWLYISRRPQPNGDSSVPPTARSYFLPLEQNTILAELQRQSLGSTIGLEWGGNSTNSGWTVVRQATGTEDILISLLPSTNGWSIVMKTSILKIYSKTTRFWQYSSTSGIDYDTTNPTQDLVTILQANTGAHQVNLLSGDVVFKVSNNIELQNIIPYQASVDLSQLQLIDSTTNINQGISALIGYDQYFLRADVASSFLPVSQSQYNAVTNAALKQFIPGDVVYFTRTDTSSPFIPTSRSTYESVPNNDLKMMKSGRSGLNFLWQHFTDQFEIINPARTNITDLYVITKQYYSDFIRWLQTPGLSRPTLPSVQQLTTAYSTYMQKAMMSDELVLRPGKLKVLFGPHADATLRATIQVVVAPGVQASNDAIKQDIVKLVRQYFDISNIEFGDTLFFSNLSSYIQNNSAYTLGSILLIPLYTGYQFGDLYELISAPDEIFVVDISVSDIQIVDQLTSANIRQ